MNTDTGVIQDDALVLVYTRNNFYRTKCHLALGIFLLSLVANAILIGILVYLVKTPPLPFYFAADEVGKLIQEVPVTQPVMSDEQLSAWVVKAVEQTYSYDFVNYRGQLQSTQKYFTEYGWRNYMKGLDASNNLTALTQRKLVAVAKVIDTPKLLKTGIIGGALAWKYQMHVLVSYLQPPAYDDKTKLLNPLLVTVTVQRQKILQSYQGLGILQFVGEFAS